MSEDEPRDSKIKQESRSSEILIPHFRIGTWFVPYLVRKRMRLADADLDLEPHCEQLKQLLIAKNIPRSRAEEGAKFMLDLAAHQQFSKFRQANERRHRKRSDQARKLVIQRLNQLDRMIAEISPVLREELDAILVDTQRFFDSESLAAFIAELARRCDAAGDIIDPPLCIGRLTKSKRVRSHSRFTDLWESMPACTRSMLEEHLRRGSPLLTVHDLFRETIDLLRHFRPRPQRSRGPSAEFAVAAARVWRRDLGLRITRICHPRRTTNEAHRFNGLGSFQRVAHTALRAFGDQTTISWRLVGKLTRRSEHA